MSDVFISYARSTAKQAQAIEDALRALGYAVWRDDELPAHRAFSDVIEERLKAAKAVVVIWSAEASASEWVRAEADLGRQKHKLVQLSVDGTAPPLPFNQIHCADLKGWHAGRSSAEWDKVVAAIDELLAYPAKAPVAQRRRSGPSRSLTIVALGGLAFALLAGGAWLASGLLAHPPAPRIALAPFRARDGSAQAQAVATTLTDKLQSALPNGPIEVVSAADAATLSGADRDEAAGRLGVGLILGGDVEDDGKTIGVSMRLDDARRHVTLWASQPTGPASQPDALTTHAARLALAVLGCASSALKPTGGLSDPLTLGLFLSACELTIEASPGQPQLFFQMFDDLRQVSARAPDFAPAHSMLASRLLFIAPVLPGDQSAMLAEGRREANRALALDPNDAEADVALASLAPVADWSGRQALLTRALAAHPDSALANASMAMLLAQLGYLREAAGYMEKAAAADPFDDDWLREEAKLLAGGGQSQQANVLLAQIARQSPTLTYPLWGRELQASLQEADWDQVSTEVNEGEAAGWLRPDEVGAMRDEVTAAKSRSPAALAKVRAELLARAPHGSPADLCWSIFELSSLGLVDDAYTLAALYTPQPFLTAADTAFLFMPASAKMRRDPRFAPLTERLGLLKYWRDTGKWPDFCADPGLPYSCAAEAARLLPASR